MKKPNITEGKWEVVIPDSEMGLVLVNTEDESTVHDGFDIANAKAISAVPNLLNEAYSTYLMLCAHPQYVIDEDQEFIDRVEGLHDALTKAGYEL